MKKFVAQIFILFICLCLIAIPVDIIVTKGLRSVKSIEFAVWNDIYNGNDMSNDLVVLGASTAWTGYNTYMMDSILGLSTYNLGVDGHPWYMYKVRYETYSKKADKPTYIIINLDKATFLDGLENPYMREQFLPYPELMWLLRKDKEFSLLELCLPYYRYIGYHELRDAGINAYMYGKSSGLNGEGCFHKGYWGQKKKWDVQDFDSTEITSSKQMSHSQLVKEDIVDFIKQRQKEGVHVVLCRYPIYRPYLNQCAYLKEYEMLCNELCDETNVPMFDFSNMELVNDTAYFYNPTHLNKRGADIFTEEFCKQLDKYITSKDAINQ